MVTRKTQYGWMATGGLICLFAIFLACKLRDGPRAVARGEPPPTEKPAKPEAGKKEAPPKQEKEAPPPALETLMPLDAPAGNPLPPIDTKPAGTPPPPPAPAAALPLLTEPKELIAGVKPAPATMPLPPPTPAGPAKGGPLPLSGPVTPAAYSPDPLTSIPPPTPVGPPPAASAPDAPPPAKDAAVPPPPDKPPSASAAPAGTTETKPLPGEPPLAPPPGPVQHYQVRSPETMRDLARRTLGTPERWTDIHKLNPMLKPEEMLAAGITIRLPGDACVTGEETEPVKPLPVMHPKAGPARPKPVLPLTGTYPANLDDKKTMTLPSAIREQLGSTDTVLVSPGSDQCLWLTNQAHLERLAQRLEQSPAREIDVRVFKRLYFAQTEKAPLSAEGRVTIPERLAQFAGLHQEVILVGIDDHFELWDAARWRQYTQQKSASHTSLPGE